MSGLHVAIIMDGNGRWAQARGMKRWRGHVAGLESVRAVVEKAPELGIGTLTLYAFSRDNWKRPPTEVGRIFWLLRKYAARERAELVARGVRVEMIGRRDRIPRSALREMEITERETSGGSRLHLRIAVDYSSRNEILGAVRTLVGSDSEITQEALDKVILGCAPPLDLLIRTAGEKRLSDFLLWESAYAEFYFTDVFWPDFGGVNLKEAVNSYMGRERRFGGIGSGSTGRKVG